MTKDKALKMAIEAIEFDGVRDSEDYWLMMDKVRTACKEALAQPAKEIVRKVFDIDNFDSASLDRIKFTSPQQWQGLSDDEIIIIQDNSWIIHSAEHKEFNTFKFASAIEAKLKELNT